VLAPGDGWVTRAASEQMLAAVPPGTTVRVETRTGAYMHEGNRWSRCGRSDRAAVLNRLSATVLLGDTRTMQEDVDFALRQLVDIGLRALSSAIDDPTTAVEVALRVSSLLRKLLVSDLPPEAVAGPGGRVLLRPWQLTHEGYIAHGFDQLRRPHRLSRRWSPRCCGSCACSSCTSSGPVARSTCRHCAGRRGCSSTRSTPSRVYTRATSPGCGR
jgi:uncharacterized membrane protein